MFETTDYIGLVRLNPYILCIIFYIPARVLHKTNRFTLQAFRQPEVEEDLVFLSFFITCCSHIGNTKFLHLASCSVLGQVR